MIPLAKISHVKDFELAPREYWHFQRCGEGNVKGRYFFFQSRATGQEWCLWVEVTKDVPRIINPPKELRDGNTQEVLLGRSSLDYLWKEDEWGRISFPMLNMVDGAYDGVINKEQARALFWSTFRVWTTKEVVIAAGVPIAPEEPKCDPTQQPIRKIRRR